MLEEGNLCITLYVQLCKALEDQKGREGFSLESSKQFLLDWLTTTALCDWTWGWQAEHIAISAAAEVHGKEFESEMYQTLKGEYPIFPKLDILRSAKGSRGFRVRHKNKK